MKRSELIEKVRRAKDEITVAEGELDEVLRALQISPGPDKVTVSEVVGDAFEKLRAAKASLVELDTLLAKDE